MLVKGIVGCARCAGVHGEMEFRELTRPFSPPETVPLRWTHWSLCPTNGEPILLMVNSPAQPNVPRSS